MADRFRGERLVGFGGLFAGLLSATVVALDGQGHLGGAFRSDQLTIYGPGQAALAVAVGMAGIVLLGTRRPSGVVAVVGLIGLGTAQLAGLGLVAVRRWPLYWGCCAPQNVSETNLVRGLAAGMALVCGVVAVTCLVILVRRDDLRWDRLGLVVALPVALVVAIAGPLVASSRWGGDDDLSALTAWALMYSLPVAAGLVVSARMPRWAALVMAAGIVGSAAVATLGSFFLEFKLLWGDARALVIVAAVVVAVTRLISFARTSAAGRDHVMS